MNDQKFDPVRLLAFFDLDARRSSPTIHFVGRETLVKNLLFDKRQLYEAYKTLKIRSDWIQNGSDWIRLDQMTRA